MLANPITFAAADPDERGFYPGERSWDDAAGSDFAEALCGFQSSPTDNGREPAAVRAQLVEIGLSAGAVPGLVPVEGVRRERALVSIAARAATDGTRGLGR